MKPLTNRERQVVDCVARGMTNREIAETLYMTERSVKNQINWARHKVYPDLDHGNPRVMLALWALEQQGRLKTGEE